MYYVRCTYLCREITCSVSMVTRNYTVCLQRRGTCRRMPTKREISAAVLSSKSFEEGALGSITPSMQRHLELTSHVRSSQETTRVSMSVQEMQLIRGTRRTRSCAVTCAYHRSQYSPSSYMAEMRLSTEERISRLSRRNQPPPQIIEFLDMAATSHAKVKAVCVCVCVRVCACVCAHVVYDMETQHIAVASRRS